MGVKSDFDSNDDQHLVKDITANSSPNASPILPMPSPNPMKNVVANPPKTEVKPQLTKAQILQN